jgi:hypothetical protein
MTTKAALARVPWAGGITRLLEEMREGDPQAAEQLLPHGYRELRALTACKMPAKLPGRRCNPPHWCMRSRCAGVVGRACVFPAEAISSPRLVKKCGGSGCKAPGEKGGANGVAICSVLNWSTWNARHPSRMRTSSRWMSRTNG